MKKEDVTEKEGAWLAGTLLYVMLFLLLFLFPNDP